ncbi:MAG: phosphoribosyl-ATP diphosphatase [Alphaproteobacteria bacterium]|nr:phosphoribosyl-ATP diphosphatase [Alphaproteobacteria bacterium]
MTDHRFDILGQLADDIAARRTASPETSYTARLLADGVARCAKKFGEEAVEAALAAVSGDKSQLAAEAADTLYHLLVMLAAAGVTPADVMAELEKRRGTGGLVEKAGRRS